MKIKTALRVLNKLSGRRYSLKAPGYGLFTALTALETRRARFEKYLRKHGVRHPTDPRNR